MNLEDEPMVVGNSSLLTVVFLWAGVLRAIGDPAASQEPFPPVKPLHTSVSFLRASTASLELRLVGANNAALYKLDCHTWTYEGDPDFAYSGDFECRLIPLYTQTSYSTLLTDLEHPTRDWQSRARFLVLELLGQCGGVPEYGRIRTFRLRGMRIQLSLDMVRTQSGVVNATMSPVGLASFRFTVDVRSDPTATTAIAASTSVSTPPPVCGAGYRSSTPKG